MWPKTSLTNQLGLQYPIIQGPFGGNFSSVELVSKVSNMGGLGSFGLNSYEPAAILAIDKEIKERTSKPYALNLWVPFYEAAIEKYTVEDFEELKVVFKPYFDALELSLPDFPTPKSPSFEAQIEAILKAKPPIVSFIFGVPHPEIIKALQQKNIKIIGTATTLEEGKAIAAANLDVIVASGVEAGGHRASFLEAPEKSTTTTANLVQALTSQVTLPIVAAGGITRGKEIAKMLDLGAAGVQMGTAFLATESSNASSLHKQLLLSEEILKTRLTKVFTGRLARAIATNLSTALMQEKKVAPYPIQSLFLSPLRKKALENKELGYSAFWAGQPSSPLTHTTVEDLFIALLTEVETTLV
ncbi:MAG: NAD(P)H-dependent flavin oxidoreductase [Aureispira sp.]